MKHLDKKSIALVAIIVLACGASFGLGRLSVAEQARADDNVEIIVPKLNTLNVDESRFKFMGSKNGTKYYPIGCKSANRIKDENKVYFNSVEEATDGGYSPAAGC
jgi:hypothetical protein